MHSGFHVQKLIPFRVMQFLLFWIFAKDTTHMISVTESDSTDNEKILIIACVLFVPILQCNGT